MQIKAALFQAARILALSSLSSHANTLPIPGESATSSNSTTLIERDQTGINCKGSSLCGWDGAAVLPDNNLDTIKGYIDHINRTKTYENGECIVCARMPGVCAFLQGVPSEVGPVRGWQIKQLMSILDDFGKSYHILLAEQMLSERLYPETPAGCNLCGSVPVNALEGGNDFSDGILTLNFIFRDVNVGNGDLSECEGLCTTSNLR